jgi:arginine:ornithine antiporter/lysine permease
MTGMVVGSMVGAGVFSLPRRFAQETGVTGALIAWVIAGTGMLMLAFVFQTLAVRKPNLDAGVYAYAKAGFGEYLGFFSAFGYWASLCRQRDLLGADHVHGRGHRSRTGPR